MAKVVITFEDLGNNRVKIEARPNFESLAKAELSGNPLTAAEGYAMSAMNHVQRVAKEQASKLKIFIPRLGR